MLNVYLNECRHKKMIFVYIGLYCVSPLYLDLLTFTYLFSFFLFSLQLVVFNFVCSFVCLLVYEDEYSG